MLSLVEKQDIFSKNEHYRNPLSRKEFPNTTDFKGL